MGPRNKKRISLHPSGTTGTEGGSRLFCSFLCTLGILASPEFSPRAHAAELGYGGRLTESSGAPVEGPVSMAVRFYTTVTGGAPVGPILEYPETPLVDGIFQLTLSLNDLQMSQVFGAGDHSVYVEVAAQGKTYPRQKFLAVPYALRIPVDGDTLTYGTDGRLTVGSISQSQVEGLALALSAKADANTVAATLAGKADSTALNTKAAVNASLSGDVSGALNGTITVDKIKNTSLPTPHPSQDGGKYLQYNGTSFVLSTVSGSSGGTVTSVTAAPPLSVTNGSTTPALTIAQASGGSSGYLATSDFVAFNNKQSVITTSSTVNAGTITTAQQVGLQIGPYGVSTGNTGELRLSELAEGGSEYVGFKAPDEVTASKIWTLPAVDGSDGQVLKTNGAGLLSWTSGLAPTGAAGGDLESNYPNPTVTKVGGVSAANIASGANAANAATAAGTPSTLVARDGSGNFTAGTITATLNGNATTATTATNVSGVVAIANGGTNATNIAAARTNLGAAASGPNSDITALSGLTTPLSVSQGGTGAATALPLTVFAGPNTGSSAGAPVFRALVAGDIPDLSVSKITSGILSVSQGGTGLSASPTSGQILIGNGSGYNLGSLVAGTNITVGNGTGAITIGAADDANKVTKSGDTMTGTLTLPSNGLVAGGSQLVLANGNVGIGTTSPASRLDVGGDLTLTDKIIHSGDTNTAVGFPSADTITAETSGAERMRITSTGNVGIGTTTPVSLLDVNGAISQRPAAAANTANFMQTNASNQQSTTNLNPGLLLFGTGNFYGMDLGYNASSTRYRTRIFAPTGSDIAFSSHAASTVPSGQSSFTDLFVINATSGSVGIGTNSPISMLDVYNTGGSYITPRKSNGYYLTGIDPFNSYVIYYQGTTGVYLPPNGTSWVANSDIRIKKNLSQITHALDKLSQLRGFTYQYKSDNDSDQRRVGVIAQDVQAVLPEAVEEHEGVLGVKYTELIPLLIEAINELQKKNTVTQQLLLNKEAEVVTLRSRADQIESEADQLKIQVVLLKSIICAKFSDAELCEK